MIIFFVCILVGFAICLPFYKKMLNVVREMDREFSSDVKGRSGFNNGVHGNFFMGKLYVLMLPMFCNLLIAFLLYLLIQKLS
ncbi:hypothetical protein CWE08_08400 [Aliidiomarina iranensis]|uniref:Uncharacterized protein n=1 Tax=Aliidiomarina iranensis TaxID=1434071 RepID=A0A432VVC0_9GAMM|nr:hypothetical protein CWE08_08400 [Aliidiomarina iranensis]